MSPSRLQKLLKLLESNNESTRKAASKQICDVAKAHPSQLVSITRKVYTLLYSNNWDTRVAAAATVGGLADAFPHHSVLDLAAGGTSVSRQQRQTVYQVDVQLASFSLNTVLSKGEPLLASGGQEYDSVDNSLPLSERLSKQRQMLRERLGLGKGFEGKAFEDIVNTDELVNEDDLAAAFTASWQTAHSGRGSRSSGSSNGGRQRSLTPEKQQAADLLRSDSMSARERNKLKRKYKALTRQESLKAEGKGRAGGLSGGTAGREDSPSSPMTKGCAPATQHATAAAAAAAGAAASGAFNDVKAAEQDEAEWQAIECGGWPFQWLADQLCTDILSPAWIVRHGAAAGLRELLQRQAAAAAVEAPLLDNTSGWASPGGEGLRHLGVVAPEVVNAAAAANAAWLEDMMEHLLCVLALDRFADYVSDQVVVPVRETAAQALGATLQPTSLATLQRVLQLLASMHQHQEWSVRHGAFTGIKYLLASRPEAAEVLLPAALPVLLAGLTDKDDSVQAAAAEALVPVAPLLLSLGDGQAITKLHNILWKLLSSMEEELSVATSSSLSLLAALYSPPAHFTADAALAARLPVLWPFLLHNMASVRMAAATSLERLATAGFDPAYAAALGNSNGASVSAAQGAWLKSVAGPCLRLLLQCIMVEKDVRVQQGLVRAWSSLLQQTQPGDVAAGLSVHDLRAMLCLVSTPCGHALDASQLVIPCQGRLVAWGSDGAEEAGFCARPAKKLKVKAEHGNGRSSSQDLSGMSSQGGSGAGALSLDPEAWPGMDDQEPAVRTRLVASSALAQLCCKLQGQEPPVLPGLLYQHLQQPAASSRIASSLVVLHWLQLAATRCRAAATAAAPKPDLDTEATVGPSCLTTVALSAAVCGEVPEALPDTCLAYLGAPGASMPSAPAAEPYREVAPLYARMRKDLYALVNASLQVGAVLTSPSGIPLELVSSEGAIAMAAAVPAEADVGGVAQAKLAVLQSATHVQLMEAYLHTSACLVLASTVVASGRLPLKLNSIIQNLMAGLRKEPAVALQEVAAAAMAELMAGVAARQPCPNEKLVKNVCAMVCGDARETPSAAAAEGLSHDEDVPAASLLSQSVSNATPTAISTTAAEVVPQTAAGGDSAAATARVGAECALRAMCERFGGELFQQLPSLWLQMSAALCTASAGQQGAASGDPQGLINAMQVVKAVVPALHPSLVPQGLQLLPQLCACLRHANAAVRLAAARCLAALAAAQAEAVLPPLLKQVVPLLAGTNTVECRLGAVEVMAHLVSHLQRQLVPYTVLLIVPLLRRMSDSVAAVRRKAALCFGSLTALLPLAQGLPLPAGLDAEQRVCAEQDGEFLSQLLDNRKVDDYSLPIKLKVELRRYQQEGINWLSFLRRFGLSGVLADDMGLGKTLQATTIMACSAAERQTAALEQQQEQPQQDGQTADEASKRAAAEQIAPRIMSSLVVCPSTLVGHWAHEVNKYVDESVLKPLAITGGPSERAAAARHLQDGRCHVAIISYEALRSDVEWAAGVAWDYVILDEGHVIRSTKSKVSQAVKRLTAQHRLVLSGTPIQNSALELWSLFDFLMPGFLGGEREFNARFGRVVNAAKYSKKGSKEAEAGTLALDALHKQVMPFILRRTKAQVLQDLPPKIVTDVLCKLSAIQQQLYEDFSASEALSEVTGTLKQQQQDSARDGAGDSKAASASSTGERHVFSALLYLRKLCSHPLLALDWSVSAHKEACQQVLGATTQQAAETALRGLEHAPKLLALQDILVQCGLITMDQMGGSSCKSGSSSSSSAAVELALSEGSHDSGHRLLVFAQLKGMLDLVESCLLKPLGVSSLRLDGSVDASARFGIVQRFNADPTIQVLLLTTHVGGLGLNLTSADTVVFLEHDWNPMKDLQAMDRAHRIGQTRTVNVYRLLMQDTLEERIMSLQQFKLDVANAVVNQDNMSMSAMDTGQLLDLFAAPTAAAEKQLQQDQQSAAATGAGAEVASAAAQGVEIAAAGRKKSALQTMLDSMGDLWDENQYQSEFDMKGFMQKLAKQQPQQ